MTVLEACPLETAQGLGLPASVCPTFQGKQNLLHHPRALGAESVLRKLHCYDLGQKSCWGNSKQNSQQALQSPSLQQRIERRKRRRPAGGQPEEQLEPQRLSDLLQNPSQALKQIPPASWRLSSEGQGAQNWESGDWDPVQLCP